MEVRCEPLTRPCKPSRTVSAAPSAAHRRPDHLETRRRQFAQKTREVLRLPHLQVLPAALGHPMRRIGGPRRGRCIRNHDARQAEKSRRARDRPEIVRVADAIEHEHRLAPAAPCFQVRRRGRPERRRRHHRDDAPVVHGAGDPFEFGRLDAPINFLGLREHLAHDADLAAGGVVEKQSLNRTRIARETRPHGREPAEFQFVVSRRPAARTDWRRRIGPRRELRFVLSRRCRSAAITRTSPRAHPAGRDKFAARRRRPGGRTGTRIGWGKTRHVAS